MSIKLLLSYGQRTAAPSGPAKGVNLGSMELMQGAMRYGQSTRTNYNYCVPRASHIAWLAAHGCTANRIPLQFELLSPCLASDTPNTTALAAMGISTAGQLHPKWVGIIKDILAAHAAVGSKALLDLHIMPTFCYQSFAYNADGSVTGIVAQQNGGVVAAYSGNAVTRNFNYPGTPGTDVTTSDFQYFWKQMATTFQGLAGLGGYGLANEPHNMPNADDHTIWNRFAQDAINAIRTIDPNTPIYVSGNAYEIPWGGNPGGGMTSQNPLYPLSGTNLVYEMHHYLDHNSSGAVFDWTTEAGATFSAGESATHGVTTNTGNVRSTYGANWVALGYKVALTEIGMPQGGPLLADLANWQASFIGAGSVCQANNIEMYAWVGGDFWSYDGFSITAVPNVQDGRTIAPLVIGALQNISGNQDINVFATANTQYGAAGTVCTVTVYNRGNLTSGLAITLTKTQGTGTLSVGSVTLPAGANTSATFTYTTAGAEEAIITFSGTTNTPSPMHFYSMDPVTYWSTNQDIAGRACLAKYKCIEWLASNALTDYTNGALATNGQTVRAIWDSGMANTPACPYGVKNGISPNYDGNISLLPALALDSGNRKMVNFAGNNVWPLWCKKQAVTSGDPNPTQTALFNLTDSHFSIASITVPATNQYGAIVQNGLMDDWPMSQLSLQNGIPTFKLLGAGGATTLSIAAAAAISVNAAHIISFTYAAGAQSLRVDGASVATGAATAATANLTSHLLGGDYSASFTRSNLGGSIYGAIIGKGAPSANEMLVMEQYLARISGTTLPGSPTPPPTDYPAGVAALTAWLDPSTLSTMQQSSVSGGAVTAAGQVVGQINSRSPGTINLTTPDTARFVLEKPATLWYLDTGATWSGCGGGGATTAFYVTFAFKITSGYINTFWCDTTSGSPNTGYELTYDGGLDKLVFSVGTGAARTSVTSSQALSFTTGGPWVVTAWDDGTHLNIQINNGTVDQSAAHGAVSAGSTVYVGAKDASGTNTNYANLYGILWAKNSALSSTDRAGIKTWLGAKAGLTL